jgi:hypothetical protein
MNGQIPFHGWCSGTIDYDRWLADAAKNCFIGYGGLNPSVLTKLDKGLTASHLKRDGLSKTLAALDLGATKQMPVKSRYRCRVGGGPM